MTDTSLGQIILFLTTLTGFGIQIYRENRNRTWARQDRDDERNERRRDTRNLAQHTSDQAEMLATTVAERHKEVIDELKVNTNISVQAFKEANDINVKIANATKAIEQQGTEELGKIAEKMQSIEEAIRKDK